MHMNEPMDWQAAMETTELATTSAAKRTDRAISGIAQLLETQGQHSSLLKSIRKELVLTAEHLTEMDQSLVQRAPEAPPLPSFNWKLIMATFAVGSLCGAFFVS